jgi:hypothetical protein
LLLFALPMAGCYHYVPALTTARQGTPLRARLNSMAAFELAQVTVNNIDQVEGEMVQVDGGDLVLSATWLEAVTGNGYAGNGWTVRIPEANVAGLEQKRLSWWRTGLVIAGIAVGTALGFESLGVTNFGGGSSGTGAPQ